MVDMFLVKVTEDALNGGRCLTLAFASLKRGEDSFTTAFYTQQNNKSA